MDFLLKNLPNSKTLPYWISAIAFSSAGYAFYGWVQAERLCAERESQIQAQARAQINEVIRDCELQKRHAQERLEEFIVESSKKYTDLARQVYKRR